MSQVGKGSDRGEGVKRACAACGPVFVIANREHTPKVTFSTPVLPAAALICLAFVLSS